MIVLLGAVIICIGIAVAYTGAAIEMCKGIKEEYFPKKEKNEEQKPEVVDSQETEKVDTVVEAEVIEPANEKAEEETK